MPFTRYRYDPTTGNAYQVEGDNEALYGGSIKDLLNGQYTLVGTTVRNARGQIVDNLGGGEVYISRYQYPNSPNTIVRLTSGISSDVLNAPSSRLASYNMTGEVTVLDVNGREHAIDVDMSSITGYGQRLMTYLDYGNVRRFEAVMEGDQQYQAIQKLYGATARWATSKEYVQAAVQGYMARNYQSTVAQIASDAGYTADELDLGGAGSGDISPLISAVIGTPS